MKNVYWILGGISALAIIILIAYAGFSLNKYINFKFGYESRVRDVIEQTVKRECLR